MLVARNVSRPSDSLCRDHARGRRWLFGAHRWGATAAGCLLGSKRRVVAARICRVAVVGSAALSCVGAAFGSDYGCQVLLCLANPAGPTAVAPCIPPIHQLWRDLAHIPPRPFPTCDEARPATAVQHTSYYDPCPDGTLALGVGDFALQQGTPDQVDPYAGIGSGDDIAGPNGDNFLRRKVCVGRQVGQTWVWRGDADSGWSGFVGIYDRVAILDPAGSPRVIDVYLNGALYRRVRW